MEETKAIIVTTLNANSGVISWGALVTAVGAQNRRYILNAMAQLEAEGIAKRQTRYSPTEGGVFEVVKV